MRLEADERIRELDAQLSLRNGELDDAFSQISKLNDDLQFKEGQEQDIIKESETSRDALLAEKNALQVDFDKTVLVSKDLESQILSLGHRIKELEIEREEILNKYSALMSEKGNHVCISCRSC